MFTLILSEVRLLESASEGLEESLSGFLACHLGDTGVGGDEFGFGDKLDAPFAVLVGVVCLGSVKLLLRIPAPWRRSVQGRESRMP